MALSKSPDTVAVAFNADYKNSGWLARPSSRERVNGVFNAVSYTYRGGLIRLILDCDAPLDDAFLIKFEKHRAAFGDYIGATQKALYRVLSSLDRAELADMPIPAAHGDIEFSIRKIGAEYRLRWLAVVKAQQSTEIDDLL